MSSEGVTVRQRLEEDILSPMSGYLKYIAVGIPILVLTVFFVLPSLYLFATSFFPRNVGAYYEFGFTLDNWAQFFESPVYREYLVNTLRLAAITTVICVILGYPIAYWIARVDSPVFRRAFLLLIIATMWITAIIRAYAIQVVLTSNGLLNQLLMSTPVISEPVTNGTGQLAMTAGMVYGFLPFAILTIYTSISNINPKLEEASQNLGASRLQTIRYVVFPLSKNGIAAAGALVFILSIGSYVIPMLLGNPGQWTLPVIITESIQQNLDVPFGAVLSTILTALTVFFFVIAVKVLGLGSSELVGDTPDGDTDG